MSNQFHILSCSISYFIEFLSSISCAMWDALWNVPHIGKMIWAIRLFNQWLAWWNNSSQQNIQFSSIEKKWPKKHTCADSTGPHPADLVVQLMRSHRLFHKQVKNQKKNQKNQKNQNNHKENQNNQFHHKWKSSAAKKWNWRWKAPQKKNKLVLAFKTLTQTSLLSSNTYFCDMQPTSEKITSSTKKSDKNP